ncbi:tRNA glutamyl-Q(34) synthetase GluQRS [Echinicola sediminis]
MSNTSYHLTRFAPTPSGYLHLGNALSFAITYAAAQKHGAKTLLRIDDLDQNRIRDNYLQDIFDTLNFLEIPWDIGPRTLEDFKKNYSQVHRLPLYNNALDHLVKQQHFFVCECSRKQIHVRSTAGEYPGTCLEKSLSIHKTATNWRLHTDDTIILLKQANGKLIKVNLPLPMKNFVVRKKDGKPSYQLASVIDDIHFGVDLIVRGQDLWDSSLAQLYLASLLPQNNFQQSAFIHHKLVMYAENKKLSKSEGATSIHGLRKAGKKKAEIYRSLGNLMGFPQPITNVQEFASTYMEKTG